MKLFWGEQPPFMPFGCGGRYFFDRLQGSAGLWRISAHRRLMPEPTTQWSCPLLSSIPLLLARNSNSCTVVNPFTSVIDGTANFACQFHLTAQPDEGTSMTPLPGLDLRGSLLSDAHGNTHLRSEKIGLLVGIGACSSEVPVAIQTLFYEKVNPFQPTASRCSAKGQRTSVMALFTPIYRVPGLSLAAVDRPGSSPRKRETVSVFYRLFTRPGIYPRGRITDLAFSYSSPLLAT